MIPYRKNRTGRTVNCRIGRTVSLVGRLFTSRYEEEEGDRHLARSKDAGRGVMRLLLQLHLPWSRPVVSTPQVLISHRSSKTMENEERGKNTPRLVRRGQAILDHLAYLAEKTDEILENLEKDPN